MKLSNEEITEDVFTHVEDEPTVESPASTLTERLREKAKAAREVPDEFTLEILGEEIKFHRPHDGDVLLEKDKEAENLVRVWASSPQYRHLKDNIPRDKDLVSIMAKFCVMSKEETKLDLETLIDIYRSVGPRFYTFAMEYGKKSTSVEEEVLRQVSETGKQ